MRLGMIAFARLKEWRLWCAVVSGFLLAGAFPPIDSQELAWIGLVPLLMVLRATQPLAAARYAFFSGLAFWLANLVWLLRLGATGTHLPIAVIAWLFLAGYCALYMAAFGLLGAWLWSWEQEPDTGAAAADESARDEDVADVAGNAIRSGAGAVRQIWQVRLRRLATMVGIALIWAGLEYLRGRLLTGFAWNPLGASQYLNVAIVQLAAWGGAHAISSLIVFFNVAVAMTLAQFVRQARGMPVARFHAELMAGLGVLALAWTHGIAAFREIAQSQQEWPTLRVAAIQPQVPQLKKWDPALLHDNYERLDRQTGHALAFKPNLLVWPETAIPGDLLNDPEAMTFTRGLVLTGGVPLLLGCLESEGQAEDEICYNSAMLMLPDGEVAQVYRKQHLVPFGEYLPLDRYCVWLRRMAPLGITCRPGTGAVLFRLPDFPDAAFASLICFEDVFAPLARAAVHAGARLLINQTNDAWFDGSSAPVQHMAHSVLRAVENRVPVVRAANSGVSCLIDATGRIMQQAQLRAGGWNLGQSGFQVGDTPLPPLTRAPSRYVRLGDRAWGQPAAFLTLGLALYCARSLRRSRGAL